MATSDKRKQSLYLPDAVADEIRAEAERLNKPFSWVFQQAWRLALPKLSLLGSQPLPRESTPPETAREL